MKLRNLFVHKATKNAAVALNMAQQVWDKEGIPGNHGVIELVQLINAASLALQRVCESIEYNFNEERRKQK